MANNTTITGNSAVELVRNSCDFFDRLASALEYFGGNKCWDDLTPEQQEEATTLYGVKL